MSDSFLAEPFTQGWQAFQLGPKLLPGGAGSTIEFTFPSIGAGIYDYTYILTDVDIQSGDLVTIGSAGLTHLPYGIGFFNDNYQGGGTAEGLYSSWRGAHIFRPGDTLSCYNHTANNLGVTGFGWVNLQQPILVVE